MRKTCFLILALLAIALPATAGTTPPPWKIIISDKVMTEGLCEVQTVTLDQIMAYIAGNCACGAKIAVVGYGDTKTANPKQRADLVVSWIRAKLTSDNYKITSSGTEGKSQEHYVIVTVECLPCPEKRTVAIAAPLPSPKPEPKASERVLPKGQARPIGYPMGYADEAGVYIQQRLLPSGNVYLAFGEKGNSCDWCNMLVGNGWTHRFTQKAIDKVDWNQLARYKMELIPGNDATPSYWFWAWDDECRLARPPRLRCNVIALDVPEDVKGSRTFKATPKTQGGYETWGPTENFVGQEGIRSDGQCLDIITPWGSADTPATTW